MFSISANDPGPLEPGTMIENRYRISQMVGSSTSTIVYSATHMMLGRAVTIEMMIQDDDKARRRFRRAARLLSMMKHPNVVAVHDMGVHREFPYLVREDLGGQTLAARSHLRGPMKIDEFVHIAQQLLSALGYIHQRKIIHRDVSGENIVFAETWNGEETLKLTQFGLSKDLESRSGATTAAEQRKLVSSLTHVAPEQILRPEEIDHRVDLYAAGAVFYQLLTSEAPFQAKTLAQLGSEILESMPVPMGQIVEHVEPQLDAVIMKALAKEPDARYESAYDMWEALMEACC